MQKKPNAIKIIIPKKGIKGEEFSFTIPENVPKLPKIKPLITRRAKNAIFSVMLPKANKVLIAKTITVSNKLIMFSSIKITPFNIIILYVIISHILK